MTTYETIAVLLSVIAFAATALNIFLYVKLTTECNNLTKQQVEIAKRQNEIAEYQNKISQGQAETEIRSLIMQARNEFYSVGEKLATLSLNQNEINKTDEATNSDKVVVIEDAYNLYRQMFECAQENLRNAYEEASSRYLDGKVDKERFKRMYMVELRNLVEDDCQSDNFIEPRTRYKAIMKVYREWNDLEKDR